MKSDWKEDYYLEKTFEFDNFSDAMVFVGRVGEIAEDINHHPDILIHDYKKVTIKTVTHSKGRITKKDRRLAKEIDKLFLNKKQ